MDGRTLSFWVGPRIRWVVYLTPWPVFVCKSAVRVCVCVSLVTTSVTICYTKVNNTLCVDFMNLYEFYGKLPFLRLKPSEVNGFTGEHLFAFGVFYTYDV